MYILKETGYEIRSSQNTQILQHNSVMFTNSVRYYTIKIWSTLETEMIRQIIDNDVNISGNVHSRITKWS